MPQLVFDHCEPAVSPFVPRVFCERKDVTCFTFGIEHEMLQLADSHLDLFTVSKYLSIWAINVRSRVPWRVRVFHLNLLNLNWLVLFVDQAKSPSLLVEAALCFACILVRL